MTGERFDLQIPSEAVDSTIANGASLSDAVNLGGMTPWKLAIPAEFDGAAITFQGSVDGSTFYNLYDYLGTEVNYPVSASRMVALLPTHFYGLSAIKVRAGTAGAPQVQTGATVLKYGLMPK